MKKELKSIIDNSKGFAVAALLTAAVLWGLQGITTRDLRDVGFNSVEMFALRAVVALAVFGLAILIVDRRMFRIRKEHIPFFLFFGLAKIVTDTLCFDAQMKLDLSLASTLLATEPYFVAIISYFVFRERLSKMQAASIFLAFFGCIIVCGIFEGFKSVDALGVLEGVGAGAIFAIYTVGLKHATTMDYNPATVLFYIFLVSTIVTIPFVDFGKIFGYMVTDAESVKNTFLFGFMYTVVPYYLQLLGLKNVSATIGSVLMLSSIVAAAIAGSIFFGEEITIATVIGTAIMAVAIIILNTKDVRYDGSGNPGK